MAIIKMRDEVIAAYGKDSYEAGYIQYVFANRETDWFITVYNELMSKAIA